MSDITGIIFQSWVPPLLSVIVGGFVASAVVPRIQKNFERNKSLSSRRMELAEKISATFSKYLINWKRLVQISSAEKEACSLSDEEKERKSNFISKRNENREQLLELCSIAVLYYSEDLCRIIREFTEWDEKYSATRLEELPPLSEWHEWRGRIIHALKEEAFSTRRKLK